MSEKRDLVTPGNDGIVFNNGAVFEVSNCGIGKRCLALIHRRRPNVHICIWNVNTCISMLHCPLLIMKLPQQIAWKVIRVACGNSCKLQREGYSWVYGRGLFF
jgi:hypothetical protein